MDNSLKMQMVTAAPLIKPYLSRMQYAALFAACGGEEKDFFMQKTVDLAQLIASMPVTYEQEGKGDDAIVFLHYFVGGSDWYITEKDVVGGVDQAYGYAILNGDDECAECGYISIKELTSNDVQMDFYFTPRSLAEIKAGRPS